MAPKTVAIIMDGNGRWAKKRGLPRTAGHKKGADTIRTVALAAQDMGIQKLILYAFSTENWKRSKKEVSALMAILRMRVDAFIKEKDKQNIRIKVIGDIKGLTKSLQKSIEKAIEITKNNTGLTLNIAFNYGGRQELVRATKIIAEKVKNNEISIEDINEQLISDNLYTAGQPDPDLLIRTSRELRTSNFLPWQLVYTEFYFPDKHWPEFGEEDLLEAIRVYQKRNRRFGGRP